MNERELGAANEGLWRFDAAVRERALWTFEKYQLAEFARPRHLVARVEEIMEMPMRIRKTSLEMRNATAMWWEEPGSLEVAVRLADPPEQQVYSLHHEFAHMLLGHTSCTALDDCEATLQLVSPKGIVRGGRLLVEPGHDLTDEEIRNESEAEYLGRLTLRPMMRGVYEAEDRVFGVPR